MGRKLQTKKVGATAQQSVESEVDIAGGEDGDAAEARNGLGLLLSIISKVKSG